MAHSDYKDWYDRNIAPFPERVAEMREYNRLKQREYKGRLEQGEPEKLEALREKARQRSKVWHANNKAKREQTLAQYRQTEEYHQGIARRSRKHAHGITDEQYQDLLVKQGGVCAICKQPETARHKRTGRVHNLTVDHDHTTGVVRGLLCRRCNNAIGWLDDDYERAQAAANYLLLSTTPYTSHRTQRRHSMDRRGRQRPLLAENPTYTLSQLARRAHCSYRAHTDCFHLDFKRLSIHPSSFR